jgi:poly(3-hydroxybutyrate) depolymerase
MMRALIRCGLLVIVMLATKLEAAVTPSAGCGKKFASGSYRMMDQNVTWTHRVFVPSGLNSSTARPLIMVFHGWGGDENEFLGDRNVTKLANQRGYILVAPRGLGAASPRLK